MVQATSAPPPDPVSEPRRSGRRPKSSTSESPSPEAPNEAGRASSSGSSIRSKRTHDIDIAVEEPPRHAPTHTIRNGRTKRKTSNKENLDTDGLGDPAPADGPPIGDDERTEREGGETQEDGVTRCICGRSADEEQGFMVMCDNCGVWQHGGCFGYLSAQQIVQKNWYCEQCRPDLHEDVLKNLKTRHKRRQSAGLHPNPPPARMSRSHSPTMSKSTRRRNTMNSRDAAYEEEQYEAALKASLHDAAPGGPDDAAEPGLPPEDVKIEEESETPQGPRRKRKRTEEDSASNKRRSLSTASDKLMPPPLPVDDPVVVDSLKMSITNGKPPGPRTARRGGPRKAQVVEPATPESEAPSKKQPNQYSARGKAAPTAVSDTTARRTTAAPTSAPPLAIAGPSSRTHALAHANAIAQQQFFTSWHLPDYLAHLEPMLPTDVPKPLEIPGLGATGGMTPGEELLERGVKVKWPAKRMSMADMNKRVRALLEWVSREQATSADRVRRREALERAAKENAARAASDAGVNGHDHPPSDDVAMEDAESSSLALSGNTAPASASPSASAVRLRESTTMQLMEELTNELINFQERFGPGAKSRRAAAA